MSNRSVLVGILSLGLALLLLVSGLLVSRQQGDPAPAAPVTVTNDIPRAEVEAFAREFSATLGSGRADGTQLCTASLQALFAQADEANRRALAAYPDDVPPMAAGPAVFFFGLADDWILEHVKVLVVDDHRARVRVRLGRVDDEHGVGEEAILVLLREEGAWRVDDVLRGGGSTRASLREVIAA